ncbi:hypothetical protein PQR64_00975 [Paraburkholderia phytofirmans]|uniref:hypothetical protein n=1 Tax=Paraburkholderia phytofirmans TaxID=261302 RepID=UPI0038BC6520
MSDARPVRLWTMLVKVRGLRVERKRRALHEARLAAQRAAADTVRQRTAIRQHEVRRTEILAACLSANVAAPLWRAALQRHDTQRFTLEEAVRRALRAERLAQSQVADASRAFQRETVAEEDARARLRRLQAEQHWSDDPED